MEILIEIIKYIILGAIQGFTEVLPISSSGHVAFVQEFIDLGIDNSVFFLIIINLGSMIAVVYYLRKDFKVLLVDSFDYIFKKKRNPEVVKSFCYSRNVVIGIIPIILVGYFFNLLINPFYVANPLVVIGVGSLFTATTLYVVRNVTNSNINRDISSSDSFYIGVFQVVSIIPGLSRLGVTTAAGLHRKLSMDSALRFTFIMFIPISIGSIFQLLLSTEFNPETITSSFDFSNYLHYIYYLSALAMSIVATYYALKWIFIWFRRGKLGFFYIYNFVFGFASIIIGITR